MPTILSVVVAVGLIFLLVRATRIERMLTYTLGSSFTALLRDLEAIRVSVAPDQMLDRGNSRATDDDGYDFDGYDFDDDNEDEGDPQPEPPFVVREVLATLRDIRKDMRRLRKRTDKQLAAPTEDVPNPDTVALEISVVGRLVGDQDERTSLLLKIGETMIPLEVTEELSAQAEDLNRGVPVLLWGREAAPNDGYWIFHGFALLVTGSLGVPQDELVARIKHKAIRHDKELMDMLREIEDFERGAR